MFGVPLHRMPVPGRPMTAMLVELVGDVVLRLHQVLLEFLLGLPATPRRVPEFPGRLRAGRIQVGRAQLPCLLCRRHRGTLFTGGARP